MKDGKKILAIIPARGGSKGISRKNIKNLAGKPLLAWTFEEAKKSKFLDRIILSSDDQEIISVAKGLGCEVPFVRPQELALDETPGIDPVLHALDHISGYDWVVLLQPTSPLRRVEDIDACIENFSKHPNSACVSVSEVKKIPQWMFYLEKNAQLRSVLPMEKEVLRRQEVPPVYALNGAIYVSSEKLIRSTKTFLNNETRGHIMPPERSLDIDTELDFKMAEFFLGK